MTKGSRKQIKSTLILLLVLCMTLSLVAGCGSSATTSSASPSPASETTEAASSTLNAEESQAVQAASVEGASYDSLPAVQLPLSENTQELSIWYAWPPPVAAITESPDGNPFYTELEKRTNVHIKWVIASTETLTETFNLMVASGDAPDMIQGGASAYAGGGDKAAEDGFIVDCKQYLDTVMPNLSAILQDDAIAEAVYTSGGRLVDFPTINDTPEGTPGGLVCRADWLKQVGLDAPVTYDDYYKVLTAFKNEIGATAPLLIPYTGFLTNNGLFAGYGLSGAVDSSSFVLDGDTVIFSPSDPAFVDCVTMLAKWYKEGLIDRDFLSRTSSRDPSNELIYGGNAGIWDSSTSTIPVYESKGGFEVTPISGARKDAAGTDFLIPNTTITSTGLSISENCADPELACRWIDYLYSKEGSFLANYGIEGKTLEYDENGDPQLTELILKNPDGLPFSLAQCIYICNQTPYFCHWKKLWRYYSDKETAAYEMWNDLPESDRHVFPTGATMNSDETTELTNIMSDIETYLSEIYFSVLVGETPTDKLSEISEQLKTMDISRAVEIKQDAYNRYKGIA